MQRSNNQRIIISKKNKSLLRHNTQHSRHRQNTENSQDRKYFDAKLKEIDARYEDLRNKYISILRENEWLQGQEIFFELYIRFLKTFENHFKYAVNKSKNISIAKMKEYIRLVSVCLDRAYQSYDEAIALRESQAVMNWSDWSTGFIPVLNEYKEEISNENSNIVTGLEIAKKQLDGISLPSVDLILESKSDSNQNENVEIILTGLERAKRELENSELPPIADIDEDDQKDIKSDMQAIPFIYNDLRNTLNLFKNKPSQELLKTANILRAPKYGIRFFKPKEIMEITIDIIDHTLFKRRKTL